MSLRSIPLFDRAGRPTTFMVRQWNQKGGAQPIRPAVVYLDRDRTATAAFRQLWGLAFPLRGILPVTAIVDGDGRATDEFWRGFS